MSQIEWHWGQVLLFAFILTNAIKFVGSGLATGKRYFPSSCSYGIPLDKA